MWGWPWAADRKTSDGQNLFQDPDWARCDGRGPQESALLSHRPPFISHKYLRHNVPQIAIFRWMKISSSVMCHRLSVLHSHYNTEPKENHKDGYLYVRGIFFKGTESRKTHMNYDNQTVCLWSDCRMNQPSAEIVRWGYCGGCVCETL